MKNLQNKIQYQWVNTYQPNSTCNVTALANGLSCLNIKVDPDELYIKANSNKMKEYALELGSWVSSYIRRKKLNQIWMVLDKLADEYLGHPKGGEFRDNWLTMREIVDCINQNKPVLIGGQFTHGGHIVCVTGYDSVGLIIDDSWGNWLSGYKDKNGDNLTYPYDKLRPILHGKDGKYRALVLSKA